MRVLSKLRSQSLQIYEPIDRCIRLYANDGVKLRRKTWKSNCHQHSTSKVIHQRLAKAKWIKETFWSFTEARIRRFFKGIIPSTPPTPPILPSSRVVHIGSILAEKLFYKKASFRLKNCFNMTHIEAIFKSKRPQLIASWGSNKNQTYQTETIVIATDRFYSWKRSSLWLDGFLCLTSAIKCFILNKILSY